MPAVFLKEGNGWKKVGGFWAQPQIMIEIIYSWLRPPIAMVACARNYDTIRHGFRDAEPPCIVFDTEGGKLSVHEGLHVTPDSALSSCIHTELHEGSWGAQEERDSLGGWSARGSDTYTRVAVRVISNLQRLVIRALIEKPNADPLAEEETIIQFESFLCEKGVGPEERARCFKQLGKVSISMPVVRTPELAVEEVGPMSACEIILDEEQLAEEIPDAPRADKRFKSESSRTQVLGDNPKEVRDRARSSLPPG